MKRALPRTADAAMVPDGVADIGGIWLEWFGKDLDRACEAFPKELARPIMERFCSCPNGINAHYPWVAFAVENFRRAGSNRGKNLSPAKFVALLTKVEKLARELEAVLADVKSATFAGTDNQPKFIKFVDTYRLLLREFSEQPDPDIARERFMWWQSDLNALGWAAREAAISLKQPHCDDGRRAEARGSGAHIQGLSSFVAVLAPTWTGMTGRAPSARRSVKKPSKAADDEPSFVQFVCQIAKAADLQIPTRSAIRTAIKTL